MKRIQEHNGICYVRLKRWRPIHNNYKVYHDYTVQIPITGWNIDTEFVKLTPDGQLTLKKGFKSDGPSGVTIDTKTFMRGALVHDGLYYLLREGFLPPYEKLTADVIIRKICLCDGMCKIRAAYVYFMLNLFAGFAALPEETI